MISNMFPGKIKKDINEKWNAMKKTYIQQDPWTNEEDEILKELFLLTNF